MELVNQDAIENGILICNKTEHHKNLIELLFESKKRTGGDDIKELHFNKSLNQYLIIYYKAETIKNVLKRGSASFDNTVYLPMEIDRTKIILENVDDRLEMDTLCLYADYLFQDVKHLVPKIERLKSGFVLVDLGYDYDVERLRLRHRRRNRLQNKEIILHLVAKHDSCCSFYTQILSSYNKKNSQPVVNCCNNSTTATTNTTNKTANVKMDLVSLKQPEPVCRSLVLIQDSDSEETSVSSSSSSLSSTTTTTTSNGTGIKSTNSIMCHEMTTNRVKSLETKLKMYESLFESLKRLLEMTSKNLLQPPPPPQQQQQTSITISSRSPPSPPHDRCCTKTSIDTPTKTLVENSLSKESSTSISSVSQASTASEFAPPIMTIKINTRQPSPSRTSLVRVRNVIQTEPSMSHNYNHNQPQNTRHALVYPNRASVLSSQLRRIVMNGSGGGGVGGGGCIGGSGCGGGLNLAMIARFPVIKYKRPVKYGGAESAEATVGTACKCSICLEYLKENQDVRLLSCFHQFHVECIDTWLMEKSTCPTCKFNLASTFCNEQ